MRFAAQKSIAMQDMLPANGSVYMPNMDNKMSSMMDALKAWEKKRGLSFSFKGKFIANTQKKKTEEKAKLKAPVDRPIKVPREQAKPVRKPKQTKEERRNKRNEYNRLYRIKNNAASRQRSKEWRAKQTPEQRAIQLERVRNYKRTQKLKRLAANAGNDSGKNELPLANCAL